MCLIFYVSCTILICTIKIIDLFIDLIFAQTRENLTEAISGAVVYLPSVWRAFPFTKNRLDLFYECDLFMVHFLEEPGLH